MHNIIVCMNLTILDPDNFRQFMGGVLFGVTCPKSVGQENEI